MTDPNGEPIDPTALVTSLRSHSGTTLELLESAWRVQRAVLHQVVGDAGRRLSRGIAPTGPREDRTAQP